MEEEHVLEFIKTYKFPLIFLACGLIAVIISFILIFKNTQSDKNVVFIQNSATGSAQIGVIRVDIAGAVIHPGVYEFSNGSRVSDALATAGGLSDVADREWIGKHLNRAAFLIDGGKIYILSVGETTEGKNQNPKSQVPNTQNEKLLGVTTGLININSASQAELETLPGVGPVTAQKIIAGRPYQSIEEIKNKKVVGQALFEKIKQLVGI